ncbi:MAG TPA: hypothetical protein VFR24_09720 [Candidatus Angelobacter sp.]|nr:hypothetical protein [Candidatus Angelobacter sp.]
MFYCPMADAMSPQDISPGTIFDRYNGGMPRRLKLSPLHRDILMMLEEAGIETVDTVIATLNPSRDTFSRQVEQLVSLGLIRKDGNNLVLTEQGKIALTT